jgi:hypothetical protein
MENKSTEYLRRVYSGFAESHQVSLSELKRKQLMISLIRLAVFIAGLLLTIWAFTFSVPAGIVSLMLSLAVFLFLVIRYVELEAGISVTGNLIRINKSELNAIDGDFSSFDGGREFIDPGHDFSADLDIFGDDSLFRYLNRCVTGSGKSQLAGWLLSPIGPGEDIPSRQKAVRELAPKIEWRQKFMAYGYEGQLTDTYIDSLAGWLAESDDLATPFQRKAAYAAPVLTLAVFSLVIAGLLPVQLFVLLFVINLFFTGYFLKATARIHERVSKKYGILEPLRKLIECIGDETFTSPVLAGIKNRLSSGDDSVAKRLKELNSIIRMFDGRLNLFAGLILNGVLLWDFHCVMRLEKWRRMSAGNLPVWLRMAGRMDAFISLASYSFNNPGYCFPSLSEEGRIINAEDLGHPLIPGKLRVTNDFSTGNEKQIFIITGANMSGKSTFLRAVAVNMILAMTGAPVCAVKMKFTPVRLFTSMRTADSLSHSESYFYAELKRLRILKESLENGDPVFFLLDEILKGTNSTDKSTGSKQFLLKLMELGGTGMLATHDISLGELGKDHPGKIVNKCFEVEIDGENILFDYKLRNGITSKMNAAMLMKQMGII